MAMPSRSVCMENSTGIAPNDMGTLHSSPRQEAAPFQPHDEITVFIDGALGELGDGRHFGDDLANARRTVFCLHSKHLPQVRILHHDLRRRRKGCFEEIFGRKSARFRPACRGDGSWSRLAHESTFAGPT